MDTAGEPKQEMEFYEKIFNALKTEFSKRRKPSVIRRVRLIQDWEDYLGRPHTNPRTPALVCDLDSCFEFRHARISLIIYIHAGLLWAAFILREGTVRIQGRNGFVHDFADPDCLQKLEQWLFEVLGIEIPSLAN